MKTFFVKTLGCKVNQVESSYIAEKLLEKGYTLAPEKIAEIKILNTCVVTAKAQSECRKIIKKWKKLPHKLIVIAGCYPQKFHQEILSLAKKHQIKNLLVLGQIEKLKISEIIENLNPEEFPLFRVKDVSREVCMIPLNFRKFFKHSRAFIKIQDGCDNFCSYCIIPYVRGKPRSLPLQEVLNQIENFLNQGYQEIVLTGIHIGKWGEDFAPPLKFSDLLYKIEELLERYSQTTGKLLSLRLSSIEPNEINEDFLHFVKTSRFIAPHFHIPLQSGSNKILKLMRRKYTREKYLEVLQALWEVFPYATFGADVIVGFPGEEERDFGETFEIVEKSPLNWLHIFPFSPRPFTPAEKMPGRVPPSEIKKREKILKEVISQKRDKFLKTEIGQIRKVVVEKFLFEEKTFKGLSENYIPVYFKSLPDKFKKGEIVKIRFLEKIEEEMKGEVV